MLFAKPLGPSLGEAKKLVQPRNPAHDNRPSEMDNQPQSPERTPVVREIAMRGFIVVPIYCSIYAHRLNEFALSNRGIDRKFKCNTATNWTGK
jgi:hypothetical protein